MDMWMVIEILNREIQRKTLVHGHVAAVRQANEWYHEYFNEATFVSGYGQANCENNEAFITYANGKGYDVHVVEVA